jgi:hypothetical protein
MAFVVSRSRILKAMAKSETTLLTDAAPAGGTNDLVIFRTENTFSADLAMVDTRPMGAASGYFTRTLKKIPGMRSAKHNFQFWMRGHGQTTYADIAAVHAFNGYSAISQILLACGTKLAVVGNTSCTYSPVAISTLDTDATSQRATVWAEHHNEIHKTVGCYGNLTLEGAPDSGLLATFDGRGIFQNPTEGAISGWTGNGGGDPKAFLGMSASITPNGGSAYTYVGKSFKFDAGVQVDVMEDFNAATGVNRINLLDALPSAEITLGMDTDTSANLLYGNTTAAKSIFTLLTAQTVCSTTWTLSGGAGNILTFLAGQCQLNGPPRLGVTRGHRTVTLPFDLMNSTGGSDFSLVVT